MLHLPVHPVRRATVVLLACLATVAALLSLGSAPARADACGIANPWSVVVTGPNGQSTTQPPYAQVHLLAVDATGAPACSGVGDFSVSWSQVAVTGTGDIINGALLDPAGNAATTESPGEGTITYQAQGTFHGGNIGGAQVTVTFVDPGPSGTTLAVTPDAPVADGPVTFTVDTSSPSQVRRWTWDFGDGHTISVDGDNRSIEHTYSAAGDYTATATVTDWIGKTDSAQVPVHVVPDPLSRVPLTAALSLAPSSAATFQDVTVTDTSTTDPTAPITDWSWDFGDGNFGSGAAATHQYPETGTFTVVETVIDALGRTATATHQVTVHDPTTPGGPPPASAGPQAAWTMTTASPVADQLTAFDGTGSTDDGGTIVDYAWSFGDGHTGSGATPRHPYADGGSYPVTLTVTDDSGRTSSATHQISVGYAPPVAAFTATPTVPVVGSLVAFDGTGSSVPAPGIATYAWSFGDGVTATGPTVAHPFRAAGTYPVTLTVTDAAGRTSSVTHPVTPRWAATDLAVSVGGVAKTGGRYAYRVTVKNLGHTGAHGAVLTNTLDPTQRLATPVKAPAGLRCGGVPVGATGTISCKAGASAVLAPGRSWVVTFTVKQPPTPRVRMVTETSQVRASNPDPVAANDIAGLSTLIGVRH